MFKWFKTAKQLETEQQTKRYIAVTLDIDFLKVSLKNIQNQLDNLDIRMLEVKKDYHKKLKQAVAAIKEEEEVGQEEEEKFI